MKGQWRRPAPGVNGFTLVELLVALGLFGVLLASLMALQSSTSAAAGQLLGESARLRNLQDATGYIASRLRSARAVSTNLTVNGSACQISPASPTDYPCFAVLTSEFRQMGSSVETRDNTYLYLVYRLIRRSDLSALDRTPNTWADSNTLAIVQSQVVVCDDDPATFKDAVTLEQNVCTSTPGNPTGFVTIPSAVPNALSIPAGTHQQVVVDTGTLSQAPGTGTFTPFSYTPATRQFVLRFRQASQERGKIVYTPRTTFYEMTVQRRN